jgi:CBS domain-containing protein
MHDVAEFLKGREPFTALDPAALDRLAQGAEIEYFTAGTTIFRQGQRPPEEIRVIRKGSVELVEQGRLLDLLGEGEMFGQAWMFSGLPTGWEARARDDTLCYSLGAEDVFPQLGSAAGIRFVARSVLALPRPGSSARAEATGVDAAAQPVRALVRRRPLICEPEESLRNAATRMGEAGATAVLIRLEDGDFGIVTDHDLRSRVVAEGLSVDRPVRDVMTTPIIAARAEESTADVMLAMLDNGVRHMPVISATGETLGIVSDVDLLAAETRTPFVLRRAIARAGNAAELSEAAASLNPGIVALHQGGLAHDQISAIISVVTDTLIRRMIELAVEANGAPPVDFAWLTLGSHGRHEAVPSSDIDSGMTWDDAGGEAAQAYMHTIAREVEDLLVVTGGKPDAYGATASGPVMARPAAEWRQSISRWLADPSAKSMMALSILLDGRTIRGSTEPLGVLSAVREAKNRPQLERLLLRMALTNRPPTGFLKDIVVEHSGAHRGSFDIKHGGLLPIVGIARYGAVAADARVTSTRERLRAAAAAGVLPDGDSETLEEAFELMGSLRLEHQIRQLEAGIEPDNYVDPKGLTALTRRHLREAFRMVASAQKGLTTDLEWSR